MSVIKREMIFLEAITPQYHANITGNWSPANRVAVEILLSVRNCEENTPPNTNDKVDVVILAEEIVIIVTGHGLNKGQKVVLGV